MYTLNSPLIKKKAKKENGSLYLEHTVLYTLQQGCGSRSVLGFGLDPDSVTLWIRIWNRNKNPDGIQWPKNTGKNEFLVIFVISSTEM
jgi:hypothetical protein